MAPRCVRAALAPLALVLAACSEAPSPLHPASSSADDVRRLWWFLFVIATLIFIAVVVLLVWGPIRRPSAAEQQETHPLGGRLVWIGGIIIPLLVLALVFGYSVTLMIRQANAAAPLTIEVIGHQWWWEVRYPNDGVTTANEIHIPVGQPVRFVVESADVIHSFWVPELQGKIDAIPGVSNSLRLDAAHAGTYRGACLTYCSLQHANMAFLLIAEPQDQYKAWVAGQRTAPARATDPQLLRGQSLFQRSACAYCHTIEGTGANGEAGPNLTHLAGRQQLAAGTLPNNPGALGGWIIDPQASKPGNKMPPEAFSGQELQDLLAYLESLK